MGQERGETGAITTSSVGTGLAKLIDQNVHPRSYVSHYNLYTPQRHGRYSLHDTNRILEPDDRDDRIHSGAVSYTHLTLPTSDLV